MNRAVRSGYTILELLIALGLLGGLLAVAWSILGTMRDAELRAEGLSQRLRARQAVRLWIEDDFQHLVTQTSAGHDSQLAFRGDSQGFTLRIRPSLDPLDFLQRLASRTSSNSTEVNLPDPEQTSRIEYRAVAVEGSLESGRSSSGLRRMLFAELPSYAERDGRGPRSERVLSGADLYRRGSAIDDSSRMNPGSAASTVPGLRRIRFRYSDGRQWRTSWDSGIQQSLPRAVELCFDLERRSSAFSARPVQGIGSSQRSATDPVAAVGAEYEATASLNDATASGKETISHEHCLIWLIEAGGGKR